MKNINEVQAPVLTTTADGGWGTALQVVGVIITIVFWTCVVLFYVGYFMFYAFYIMMMALMLATAFILQLFLIPFRW